MSIEKLTACRSAGTTFGCDPEFFFRLRRRVIGSEHVIPAGGLDTGWGKAVIDGVQAELNPTSDTCRANIANRISRLFKEIDLKLKRIETETGKAIKVDFSRTVKISKTELEKLNPNNQVFGCTPSKSAYNDTASKIGQVNPLAYRYRSAGGHIHIGGFYGLLKNSFESDPDKIVKLLDVIVGNTFVLLDRDKGNVTRRKMYGRAGEYRTPKHGLEYRVLSNVWLQDYRLMSLAMGLTRLALGIANSVDFDLYWEEINKAVKLDDIRKAINTNNYDLAMKNYDAIVPILSKAAPDGSAGTFGISERFFPMLRFVAEEVKEKGLTAFFTDDSFKHWCTLPEAHGDGAATFFYDITDRYNDYIKKQNQEKVTV